MKKKTIYIFQKSNHPALQSLYNKSPKNVKIVFRNKILIENSKKLGINIKQNNNRNIYLTLKKKLRNFIQKLFISFFFEKFNLPLIIPIFNFERSSYDFILSNNLVFSNKKIIYYFEYIGNFNDNKLKKHINLIILKNFILNSRCKYVLTWSESAKNMIIETLNIPKRKRNKFQTIYPTIDLKENIIRNDKVISLLFVSSIWDFDKDFNFYMKGGKLVLQAFKELKRRHQNIQLIFVGYIPPVFKSYINEVPNIKHYIKLSHEKILELYKNSDIFLFPTYGDTFGFTFIEAMAYGLPIICLSNNFAANELVINNKSGFIVKTSQKFLKFPFSKYCPDWCAKMIYYNNLKKENDKIGLKNLIEKIEILVRDNELRKNFGEFNRNRIISGDLSLKSRNNKLYNLLDQ